MKIDFKKELETASRGMIMVHDPNTLIKLIIRMIVRKLGITHAAMILYDPDKDTYVLSISRGKRGIKVPSGFTRFDKDSPIIKLFTEKEFKLLIADRQAIVYDDINRLIWRESVIENGNGKDTADILHRITEQMEMFNSLACVPAFYHNKLLAVLLLGEKEDGTKFEQDELDFFAALASDAAMAVRNAQLFLGLKKESKRNRELFIQTIIVLGATIEAKDAYTHGHTERVTKYSLAIARQMTANGSANFDEKFYENLYIAGLLHDIGKIAIPEAILNKTGKLTPDEWKMMQQHTIKGVDMLKPLGLPKDCIDGIKYHHESFDGSGYPDGLLGEATPMSAAIIAVADTFDAMTSDRSYRKGLEPGVAIKEIKKLSGIQFNPVPAKAIVELFEVGGL